MNEAALGELVREGGEKSAALLTNATGNKWGVAGVAVSGSDDVPFEKILDGVARDHYGSHFTVPGATFLVVFSGKSGYLVTTAFTRDHQDSVEGMPKLESRALAEVANMLLNPLLGHLSAAWKRRLMISAPKMQIASPRDLLLDALARFKEKNALAGAVHLQLSSSDLFSDCSVLMFLDAELIKLSA
jgi:hypothetical protein